MKYYFIFFTIVFLVSCQAKKKEPQLTTIPKTSKPISLSGFELGQQLFNGKGKCKSCHQINSTSIGPSISAITEIYKRENGDIVKFLKQEADPIVKPETYSVMKTNFALLKTFTDEELRALEKYMKNIVR